jgi:catechol 2,3-dioxygenase-like lactoylglutathione lyase family enzyme
MAKFRDRRFQRQMGEVGMLDHIGLSVKDFQRSKAFYLKALAPLSLTLVMEVGPEKTGGGAFAGFGAEGKPFFWIGARNGAAGTAHVAFTAPSRAVVNAFYAAALEAGGKDNGAPGLRPHYHDNYYGSFVLDPDGNNIEAVCHKPE